MQSRSKVTVSTPVPLPTCVPVSRSSWTKFAPAVGPQETTISSVPPGAPTEVVVRAVRDDFACQFAARTGARGHFTLPVGTYKTLEVTVRPGGAGGEPRLWSPGRRVLLRNLWDISSASVDAGGPAAEAPVSSLAAAPVLPTLVPATKPLPGPASRPSLAILSPTGCVERRITVAGRATGLEGATVQIVVRPLGDIDYLQDGSGTVVRGQWEVPAVIIGRAGDSGKTFRLRAEARRPDGTVVYSPAVTVVRR